MHIPFSSDPHNRKLLASVPILLPLLLAILLPSPSQAFITNSDMEKIEVYAEDLMACAAIPGLTMAVVKGHHSFHTGLGVASMDTVEPADSHTRFPLGSTSKVMVPYLLAQIMGGEDSQDGRLAWSTSLGDAMNGRLDTVVGEPWAGLTLTDMLVHQSGGSAVDFATMAGTPHDVTREDWIRRLSFLPESEAFSQSDHFVNLLHTIAGHVAEKGTGKAWQDLVHQHLVSKLGMGNTGFAPEGLKRNHSALPYRISPNNVDRFQRQDSQLFDLHPSQPSGSLMTSSRDMSLWLKQVLADLDETDGQGQAAQLVRDAFLVREKLQQHASLNCLRHDSEKAEGFGMGWVASTYRGHRRYHYSGSLYAYASKIWLVPDERMAIFVAVSGKGTEDVDCVLDSLLYYTADTLTGHAPWVRREDVCRDDDYYVDYVDYSDDAALPPPPPAQTAHVRYLAPVGKYVGMYGHGFLGNLMVSKNVAGLLVLTLGRNLRGELLPAGSEKNMILRASGPLANTDQWDLPKEILFSYREGRRKTFKRAFDKITIAAGDGLYYDFRRGLWYENALDMQQFFSTTPLPEETTTATTTTATSTTTSTVPSSTPTTTQKTTTEVTPSTTTSTTTAPVSASATAATITTTQSSEKPDSKDMMDTDMGQRTTTKAPEGGKSDANMDSTSAVTYSESDDAAGVTIRVTEFTNDVTNGLEENRASTPRLGQVKDDTEANPTTTKAEIATAQDIDGKVTLEGRPAQEGGSHELPDVTGSKEKGDSAIAESRGHGSSATDDDTIPSVTMAVHKGEEQRSTSELSELGRTEAREQNLAHQGDQAGPVVEFGVTNPPNSASNLQTSRPDSLVRLLSGCVLVVVCHYALLLLG